MNKADFIARFTEFSEVSDELFNFYNELFESMHNESAFTSNQLYVKANGFYVAHCLSKSGIEKAHASNVTSEKIGDMSLSYKIDDNYDSSEYGRQYKAILKIAVGPKIFVGGMP